MPSLTDFRQGFFGVRANRFMIDIQFPGIIGGADRDDGNSYIYVKAADVPGSQVGQIGISWQGRLVKFSGERAYSDWVIQIYDSNRKGPQLREKFEEWMELMDGRNSHIIDYNTAALWKVYYSDVNGTASAGTASDPGSYQKVIKLHNCFPVDLGAINLNYDAVDTFADFTVQMAYDYWEFELGGNEFVGPPSTLA